MSEAKVMNVLEIVAIIAYCIIGVVFVFPFAHYAFTEMVRQNRVNMVVAMFIGVALAVVWPLALLGMFVRDQGT